MRLGRLSTLVLAAIAAAGLAGCATASHAAETPRAAVQLPEPTYAGALAKAVTYAEPQITLALPRADDKPTADWRAAYKTCGVGNPVCNPTAAVTVSYARATVAGYGDIQKDAKGDPSVALSIQDRLVYVFDWPQSACLDGGTFRDGIDDPTRAADPGPVSTQLCRTIAFIDAVTGEAITSRGWSQG